MNLFELVTADSLNDTARIRTLMRYVEGEALTWFGDEIAPNAVNLDWATVRERMIARFGQIIIRPMIAAHKRNLKSEESVQFYYEEKMNLIRQTTMTEEDRIACLTEGMPFHYHNHLISSNVRSTGEWLSKALQLESSMGKRRSTFKPLTPQAAFGTGKKIFDPKKKPDNPCRFCKAKGKELYHWHNECRLNPNPKPKPQTAVFKPAVNTAQGTDRETVAIAQALAGQEN